MARDQGLKQTSPLFVPNHKLFSLSSTILYATSSGKPCSIENEVKSSLFLLYLEIPPLSVENQIAPSEVSVMLLTEFELILFGSSMLLSYHLISLVTGLYFETPPPILATHIFPSESSIISKTYNDPNSSIFLNFMLLSSQKYIPQPFPNHILPCLSSHSANGVVSFNCKSLPE